MNQQRYNPDMGQQQQQQRQGGGGAYYDEADRRTAMMRQQQLAAQRQQQTQMPGAYAPGNLPGTGPPGMPPQSAVPSPMGAPRPRAVTGSGPGNIKGSPGMDPARKRAMAAARARQEKMVADSEADRQANSIAAVNQLVLGLVALLSIASIFVLPKQLKVYAVLIISLTAMVHLGLGLFKEFASYADKGGEENAKYAEWGGLVLMGTAMLYTGVMVGLLFFMLWSLYSIANSRSNIARLDKAALSDYELDAVAGDEPPPMSSSSGKRHRRRHGRRH